MHFTDKPSHTLSSLIPPCPRKPAVPLTVKQESKQCPGHCSEVKPDMEHLETIHFWQMLKLESLSLKSCGLFFYYCAVKTK